MKRFSKKEIDIGEVNEVVDWGKKILKLTYTVMIIGLVLCVFLFFKSFGVFTVIGDAIKICTPLLIGFIIAWLFNKLEKKLQSKGVNKVLSALIIYAGLFVILFIIIRVFIPLIYSQLNDFVGLVPNIINSITKFITGVFDNLTTDIIDLTSTKEALLQNLSTSISDLAVGLPSTLLNFVVGLFSAFGILGLGLVIGIYMLMDFDKLMSTFLKIILPKKYETEVYTLLKDIGVEVRHCVNGTLLVALMVFVCDTIGFTIVGLNGALLFGLFCGITDLIPYIGPYLGGAVAAIIGFTQSPIIGVGVIIIAVIVQLVENYVLQPVVMSKATQLNPIIIMVALLLFGKFFGIFGMVFAMPILSIVKVIVLFFVDKYELFNHEKVVEE